MSLTIHQSINIHLLRIESVTNSSVVQIGSTGSIQGKSDIHNTGSFIELAEEADPAEITPLVPLSPVTN